ncbi:hypothetical protein L6452_08208 [Arctium lappa]|uniref:Uncharacterized protein n=1 Tax=Arctium lappa TaxID=4217 RepID=A0ACB9DGP0_ARCLA|nr:hypothetical protein L6452_08208 [Arctium lappa]
MVDGLQLPFKKNISYTKYVSSLSHAKVMTVEDELGRLSGTEDSQEFIDETSIDALADTSVYRTSMTWLQRVESFSFFMEPPNCLKNLSRLFSFILVIYVTIVAKKQQICQKNVSVSTLIAFGDSFVDQGNNNYIKTFGKANFIPYGKDFRGGKPTGRFSNGKTVADFLAEALGVKEYLPAYLDPSLQAKDLLTSIRDALNYFVLPIRRLQYDVPDNKQVKLALNFVQEIYKLGARKIVVFGAPPIGCTPIVRTTAGGAFRRCQDKENNAAQLFNSMLKQHLQVLASSLPQSSLAFVDI